MWYDHPFSQGNKTTKKRGLDKQNLEKKKGVGEGGGRQYRESLHKIGEFGTLCHLWVHVSL